MKASATLLAVAVLAVGCAGADSEDIVVVGSESGPSSTVVGSESGPSPVAGLAHCDES